MALLSGLPLSPIILVIVIFLLVQLIQIIHRNRQFRLFALSRGAEKPVREKFRLPWAIDGLYETLKAARTGSKDVFEDIYLARQRRLNRGSWYVVSTGNREVISTCDPRNFQAILSTQFDDFEQGPLREAQLRVVLGRSIFNSDGEHWSRARALFRPIFSRSNINDLDETERAIKIFLNLMPKADSEWTEVVNLQPMLYRFTLDTATAFIFGKSVESQTVAAQTGYEDAFSKSFKEINEWITVRILLQQLYFLSNGRKFRNSVDVVRKFADQVIEMALKEKNLGGKKRERYSVIEELVQSTDDPTEIRDQVLALLAAGRDTTAAVLSWVFFSLATNPDIFNKLRKAIITDFGTTVNDNSLPDFGRLKSCRYLQWVISETLRLYPTVPLNVRSASRDTTLPVGGGEDGSKPIPVRKGQTIGMIIFAMHRRKDIWGEDADEFKPERWENRKMDWSYSPFSGGPRICLGQQYAIIEASYLLVRFLQTFDAIIWEGTPGRQIKGMGITLFPKHGIPVKLRYAKV